MKTLKYFFIAVFAIFLWGCSEDIMDDINKDVNNASDVDAFALLPDALLKTTITATATDLAWFSSQWAEHSAGQWAQSHDDDRRIGMNATSNFNNSWVGMYDLLNILKDLRERCSPGGAEENNLHALGIAQVLTAYNLAILTDFFGEVPWSEALQGAANPKPKYDNQSELYSDNVIFKFLDDGIANLQAAEAAVGSPNAGAFDYMYAGDNEKWIKAAYSIKARLHMRLTQRDADASSKALTALALGFDDADDNFMFDHYEASAIGENPWYQYMIQRSHLAASETLYDLMNARNDPRIDLYFTEIGGGYNPAPSGEADRVQGGTYSESLLSFNGRTTATPLMTFHELKFIEAEARQREGQPIANVKAALLEAIQASFEFHGEDADDGEDYFIDDVEALVDANALQEILIQKYIAMYEHESMEAYHQVRRTGVPTMRNPNNATAGFPNRCPGGNSEESNNPDNFISVDVLSQKIWWAGGDELAK